MNGVRVPLYDRLPEIHRIKDAEQSPPGQLKSYLAAVEEIFSAIHENVESLYHDLFIETSDEWVIPYIGDLLGTSHLAGDPRTLRADVADTIALRRRKGTLAAIELLTFDLTQWGVHCVELRESLVWHQHLNHQRPDAGGLPPYGEHVSQRFFNRTGIPARHRAVRGGTITLRDPAMLSLLGTAFDPYAHTVDVKPPAPASIRYNLPNLAIFLWRLQDYQVPASQPFFNPNTGGLADHTATAGPGEANFVVQFHVHPVGEPIRLFNRYRFNPNQRPLVLTRVDETPGHILPARLTEGSPAGSPADYFAIETYDETDTDLSSLDISEVGLQLHLPESTFAGQIWPMLAAPQVWKIRGANLCAWEDGLQPALANREVAIDPIIGRIVIGVATLAEAQALVDHLVLTHTYAAVGPVGAHPISRPSPPEEWNGEAVQLRNVNFHQNPNGLRAALNNLDDPNTPPVVIVIEDSMTHELDLSTVAGTVNEDGGPNLSLNRSLIIRAADNQRPVIRLAQPLRFRPTNVLSTDPDPVARAAEQEVFDAIMANLTVRLEGLYLTRGEDWDDDFSLDDPLIARAALHSLEIFDCTLDPGGSRVLDGTLPGSRSDIHPAMNLKNDYGFSSADEKEAFDQMPDIILRRTIAGPLFIDSNYRLFLTESIIDAGSGANEHPATAAFAISGASGEAAEIWGPATQTNRLTVFGRMRVTSISGQGGIWVHRLEVLNNQIGCIKFSYFSGQGDRLPQNHGCVNGTEAKLRFTSEIFGEPAYGQLTLTTDFRIRERGPKDDLMGAFGFLLAAHKWRNLQIRFREFMPVGVRPLLIPLT